MNSASATRETDVDPRSGAHAAQPRSRPAAWRSANADETTLRRQAKRQALLLMAASSLVMIALLAGVWLVFR
jgi:Tfp pilus assembly protein PilN